MKIVAQHIAGLYEIRLSLRTDARGAFARTFCAEIFANAGLQSSWAQMNMSRTIGLGTLRGLHFQSAPAAEAKLIRVTEGKVFDLALDLRGDSPTFGLSQAITLSAEAGNAIYIPEGCAHGFQTLTETATLHYCHSAPYMPGLEGGVLATDPDLEIDWPLPIALMSERDQQLPNLRDVTPL